jgi:hypothetical protein
MRVMFWAGRKVGLDQNVRFWEWFGQFIRHFIRVYEIRAPAHQAEAQAWSADQKNIDAYLANNRKMDDVIDHDMNHVDLFNF